MSRLYRVRLGDVISIKHGFAFPGDGFTEEPSFPTLVTPGNFAIGGGFKPAKPKTFQGGFPEEYVLAAGDLIVSMTDLSKEGATLGLPALVPDDGTYLHNQRVGLVQVTDLDRVDRFFLHYFLRTTGYRAHILGTATGSTVRHTSPTKICSFAADLPDLVEQRAIADVLGAFDDKIAANTNLIETASALAMALLSDCSPSVALAEVVVYQKRSIAPADFGNVCVAHFSLPAFDTGQRPQMTSPQEIKSSKFSIEKPCVLVSKLNPRFPRIWDVAELPRALAISSTEFLVLESERCASTVLWAILSQPSFSAELESKVAGTSGSHQRVGPDDLLATKVIDPRSLSQELMSEIESLGRRIALGREESTTLAQIRDALLPQLMSGKIRVKDAEQIVGDVV